MQEIARATRVDLLFTVLRHRARATAIIHSGYLLPFSDYLGLMCVWIMLSIVWAHYEQVSFVAHSSWYCFVSRIALAFYCARDAFPNALNKPVRNQEPIRIRRRNGILIRRQQKSREIVGIAAV